jgi:hypothetical protein
LTKTNETSDEEERDNSVENNSTSDEDSNVEDSDSASSNGTLDSDNNDNNNSTDSESDESSDSDDNNKKKNKHTEKTKKKTNSQRKKTTVTKTVDSTAISSKKNDDTDDNSSSTDSSNSTHKQTKSKNYKEKSTTSKKLSDAFSRSYNSSNNSEEYSIRFKFVTSKANGVKDFVYVSLESDNDVSIWMSSLYMANIFRVYGDIYMKEADNFKEAFMSAQSLKRRATPYGENEPLKSKSSKLNKLFDVYGLFFIIPTKRTDAFIKLFKKIMISDEMKKTVNAWKNHQKESNVEPNQLAEAITSFDSSTWKCITKSCQKDFENARSEESSLDALILNYDINNILRKMYNYKGDNFNNVKEIKNTGWHKSNTNNNNTLKKVKSEK